MSTATMSTCVFTNEARSLPLPSHEDRKLLQWFAGEVSRKGLEGAISLLSGRLLGTIAYLSEYLEGYGVTQEEIQELSWRYKDLLEESWEKSWEMNRCEPANTPAANYLGGWDYDLNDDGEWGYWDD